MISGVPLFLETPRNFVEINDSTIILCASLRFSPASWRGSTTHQDKEPHGAGAVVHVKKSLSSNKGRVHTAEQIDCNTSA